MCRVIAIANNKGGVGKTTTCASLAYGLVNRGRNVLVIDADPQGSMTTMFGVDKTELGESTYTILKKVIKKEEFDRKLGIQKINGVDILPTADDLNDIDVILPQLGKENILKRYINSVRNKYDYILIDCQPAINMLVINCLVAADSVIIPVKADMLSYEGTALLFDLINQIIDPVDGVNTNLVVDGVLITIAKQRTKSFKAFQKTLAEDCGDEINIFSSIIPDSIKGADVSASGKSIYDYDKKCSVAKAYHDLTEEILSLEGGVMNG